MTAVRHLLALSLILFIGRSACGQTDAAQPDEPPTFNGAPVFVSTLGGKRIGGTSAIPTQPPPPKIRASRVSPEEVEQGAYDPRDTLELLMAWRYTHQTNTAVFGLWDQGAYEETEITFRLRAGIGGLGGAIALLPTATYGDTGPLENLPEDFSWDEPNLPGGLAIAFDTNNPPTANWFNEVGNIYDRPQREVSVHFNNTEIANALSPIEYRAAITDDEEPGEGFHDVRIHIEHVFGGGYVSVSIDDQPIFERLFVPELEPYEYRLAFGASSSEFAASFDVRAVQASVDRPAGERARPVRARLIDEQFVHAGNREPEVEVELPDLDPAQVGRVILTLTLDPGLGGCDPWDKKGAIYLWGEDGTRYELVRFITPYGRPYQWKVDVTDFALLLRDTVKAGLFVDTWMTGETLEQTRGWTISVDLDYYPGQPEREVIAIENLWVGEPEYGYAQDPMQAFFDPREITLPEGADGALLRMVVTGHGMSPATYNAAEFMPADRTLIINGERHIGDLLWNEDSYLNPCRPQFGSWKFDRAGWYPGSIARRWDVDLTEDLTEGPTGGLNAQRGARLEYRPMAYTNEHRMTAEGHAPPSHWVESQVFYYKQPE